MVRMRKQKEREGTLNRKMLLVLAHQGKWGESPKKYCSCLLFKSPQSSTSIYSRLSLGVRVGLERIAEPISLVYVLVLFTIHPFLASFLPSLSKSACIHSVPPLNPGLLLSIRSDRPCVLLADWQILGDWPLFLFQITLQINHPILRFL